MQRVNAKADIHDNEDIRLSEVSVQLKELYSRSLNLLKLAIKTAAR